MFGSTILDVAIGLAFVYLLLSLMCTTVNEWIAAILATRAKTLKDGLSRLLGGQGVSDQKSFLDAFYSHPLIKAITQGVGGHPSYVPARSFALAIIDVCTPGKPGPITFDDLLKGIQNLPEGEVKKTLLALLQNTDEKVETAQRRIEDWFNDSMDRVSGWFKRKTQLITAVVAVFVALLANADTLQIGNKLWLSPTLRAATVERARVRAEGPRPLLTAEYPEASPKPSRPSAIVSPELTMDGSEFSSQVRAQIADLIGWSGDCRRFNQFSVERELGIDPVHCAAEKTPSAACVGGIRRARAKGDTIRPSDLWSVALLWWIWWLLTQHLVGWALTVVALSLGAPFWFDALKGLVNLRAAGKPPEPDRRPQQTSDTRTTGK